MSTNATTVWSISLDPAGPSATLTLSIDSNTALPIRLKGICYSPCPINGSNAYAPAIGDWFWDSYSGPGYSITGWEALWARDLPNIRALGANSIRVYNMMSRQLESSGQYPNPWNSETLFTHTPFLDMCWNNGTNPLYVLVGIALPQELFWQTVYNPHSSETIFWVNVLKETVQQVGSHPAVLGFIVENEQDAANVTYCSCTTSPTADCESNAQFWWSQVEAMAQIIKGVAPGKLVGIASHDDPYICGEAASYMANCPHIDFWGVNTYQPQTFQTVFGANGTPSCPTPGYGGLSGSALKAVIITEYGFPVTSRNNLCSPQTIYANDSTIVKTANVLAAMLPQAYAEPLNLGLYYFEYCDEWWNQSAYQISQCGNQTFQPPNIYTWYGGPPASGFPNGYWDQDGFGLYAQQRGPGLGNGNPIWCQSGENQGPCTPIDVVIPREGTINAVQKVFATLE